MPRTRHDVARDEKVDEIVDAAKRQLFDGGFAALSMAGVARELGVAQNAIYWYFPTRDHLFVAVLRQLMAEIGTQKGPASTDVFNRAVWFVDRVADVHPLLVTVRERSHASEVVADLEREIDTLVRGMVAHALGDHIPKPDVRLATESFLATIEGALLRQLPRNLRAEVVIYTLARLSGVDPPPRASKRQRAPRKA